MSDSRARITLYASDLEPELSEIKERYPRLSRAQIATLMLQRARDIAGTLDPFAPQPDPPAAARKPRRSGKAALALAIAAVGASAGLFPAPVSAAEASAPGLDILSTQERRKLRKLEERATFHLAA